MKNTILNRFQRIVVLPLIVLLACLVIGLSWWTIDLQIGILKADLDRTGTSSVENLSKSSLSALVRRDKESLINLMSLVKENDPEVFAVTFMDIKGSHIISDGEIVQLPLDPDRLKFIKSSEILRTRAYNYYISPVMDKNQNSRGIAAIMMSKEDLNRTTRRSRILFTLICLIVVGFNLFIYHYIVREALRASQMQKAYDDLKRLQDQILQSEKMAAIGRLASGVGHELRNPLGAIKNAVYYIKDAIPASNLLEKDPTVGEFIEVIETEIKSATAIISDLLDYSKVGKLHPQQTDINSLLLEIKSVLDIPPACKFVVSFAASLPKISADPIRLRQVFLNLAQNAFQAMPNGGDLIVSTSEEKRDDKTEVWISFKDVGSGIPEENLKKIFEPLFTTKDKGTGLGLAICMGIVEAHGGKIDVKSSVGKGSDFIVKLPLESKKSAGGSL